MVTKRKALASPDIQFTDENLNRLSQFVRQIAAEIQSMQQMLRAGNAGQSLVKNTTNDYDASWESGGAGTITGAKNVGPGGSVGLFDDLEGSVLAFKSLIAGTNISLTVGPTSVTVSAAGGGGGGSGTVTSVGINSTDLAVTGSPITVAGSIGLAINANAVTYAKMQQTSVDGVVLGRKVGDGVGNVEELASSDLLALIGGGGYPKQLAYAGVV